MSLIGTAKNKNIWNRRKLGGGGAMRAPSEIETEGNAQILT